MNEIVSKVIYAIGGAIVGAAVSYFICNKKFEKQVKQEVEAYKNTVTNDEPSIDKNDVPQEAIDAVKAMQNGVKKASEDHKNVTKYSSLTRNEDLNHRYTVQGGRDLMAKTNDDPYFITLDEYRDICENGRGYNAEDLYYNTDTDSVYMADGSIFEDAHHAVGWDILQYMFNSNEDEFYVKNDNLKEAYCIVKNAMI